MRHGNPHLSSPPPPPHRAPLPLASFDPFCSHGWHAPRMAASCGVVALLKVLEFRVLPTAPLPLLSG
eukprot:362449-Chlamydomonas_euryale.AAC.1